VSFTTAHHSCRHDRHGALSGEEQTAHDHDLDFAASRAWPSQVKSLTFAFGVPAVIYPFTATHGRLFGALHMLKHANKENYRVEPTPTVHKGPE
jgi:hypothetical protein